jgi:hypothetical protein
MTDTMKQFYEYFAENWNWKNKSDLFSKKLKLLIV